VEVLYSEKKKTAVAMGRCHHHARCYVHLLTSRPDHSSNRHGESSVPVATEDHSGNVWITSSRSLLLRVTVAS
jgi:hypothetical protein